MHSDMGSNGGSSRRGSSSCGGSGGSLICWGCGEHGQHCHGRGVGDVSSGHGLVKNFGSGGSERSSGRHRRVVAVACGSSHTVALTENNEIYSWGNGSHGQLGTGDCEIRWQPTRIDLFKDGGDDSSLACQRVAGICCGGRQTLAWLESGQACCFGLDQLGDPDADSPLLPPPSASALTKQSPRKPPRYCVFDVPKVRSIACGESHSIFLFEGGSLGARGLNAFGQLGTGDRIGSCTVRLIDEVTHIKTVACGAEHSFALAESGKLLVWGYGKAIGYEEDYVLKPTERVHHNTNISMMAGGRSHCVVLTETGNVYTWGGGGEGQLGHGADVTYSAVPRKVEHAALKSTVVQVAAGDLYSAAVTNDGQLFMWGKDSHVIGANTDPSARSFTPRLINTFGQHVHVVACGSWHAACIASAADDEHSQPPVSPQVADYMSSATAEDDALLGSSYTVALAGSGAADQSTEVRLYQTPASRLDLGEPPSPLSQSPPRFAYQVASEQAAEIARLVDVHDAAADARSDASSTTCPDVNGDQGQTPRPSGAETERQRAASGSSRIDAPPGLPPLQLLLPQLSSASSSLTAAAGSGIFPSAVVAWGASFDVAANPSARPSAADDGDRLQLPPAPRTRRRVANQLAPSNPHASGARPPWLRSDTVAFVPDKPSGLTTSSSSQQLLLLLPGLLRRSATDLPDQQPHLAKRNGVTEQQQQLSLSTLDSGFLPHRAPDKLATAAAATDGHTTAPMGSRIIGFLPKHALQVPSRSAQPAVAAALPQLLQQQQPPQRRRETAEERLLREMRAKHEELFLKEKALRRQLLHHGSGGGGQQHLPQPLLPAQDGSMVAQQVLKGNVVASADIHMRPGSEIFRSVVVFEAPVRLEQKPTKHCGIRTKNRSFF